MAFGLAEPETLNRYCERFKSILANFVIERRLPGLEKTIHLIPGERFGDLVVQLARMLDEHFESQLLPRPTLAFLDLGTSGAMACFQPEPWQVAVNIALIRADGDHPRKFAPVVFSSLYHEYRHAEQYALMIRYALAQDPKWLQYQNVLYGFERNQYVTQRQRVPEPARIESFSEWELSARRMSDQAITQMINRSLSTVAGGRVSLNAVRRLRLLPLGRLGSDTQEMMDQAALWFQSRFRSRANPYFDRKQLFDVDEVLEVDETRAANLAMNEAQALGDAVDAEIREWNKTRPTDFPTWRIAFDTIGASELNVLRSSGRPFDASAAKACHVYLKARRTAARRAISATHGWYVGVPLESDTHSLERQVAEILRLSSKTADKVALQSGVIKNKFLPQPKDWSLEL